MPARHRSTRLLAAPVLTALLATAGCGASHSGTDAVSAAQDAPQARSAEQNFGNTGNSGGDIAAVAGQSRPEVQQRAVVSTGQIQLASGDVAATRDRVDTVLAHEGGRIADESTTTDERGTVTRTHLVVRVPSDRFDEAMTSLAGLGTLRSSSRKAEDVTTQVIDVDARVAAQRAGVRRLRHLISRAANLPALLAVERELSARQGELESLLQQRAFLADQTSLATISVDVARRTAPSPASRSTGGFVGGLRHGWHALVAVVVGVLVAVGAALPFALAALVLGVPVWLVVRRSRRPRQPQAPVET